MRTDDPEPTGGQWRSRPQPRLCASPHHPCPSLDLASALALENAEAINTGVMEAASEIADVRLCEAVAG